MDRGETVLIIGVGGSGRTHRLRQLARPDAVWIHGSPHQSPIKEEIAVAVASAPSQLIVDDVQWLDEGSTATLTAAVPGLPILASRRPWPVSQPISAFDDAMSASGRVERLGRLDLDNFGAAASSIRGGPTSSDLITRLFEATGGLVGLLSDSLSVDWDGDLSEIPDPIVEAIAARASRAGPEADNLVQLLAMEPDLATSVVAEALVEHDPDLAEKAAHAGGLVGREQGVIPIVGRAIRMTTSGRQRASLHDQLARALVEREPEAAITHLLSGSGEIEEAERLFANAARRLAVSQPDKCLDLIEEAADQGFEGPDISVVQMTAAFQSGRHDAMPAHSHSARIDPIHERSLSLVAFGIDVRDLRWEEAAAGRLPAGGGPEMRAFANTCVGVLGPPEAPSTNSVGAEEAVLGRMTAGLREVVGGSVAEGTGLLATAADDYDRQPSNLSLGITPHFVAASCFIWLGDAPAANGLLDQAMTQLSGGPGEATSHRLLSAYTGIVGGDYGAAVEVLAAGESTTWPLRDRLLYAAIDAAIARRSGDTTRLRDAWARSESILLRPTGSWLFLEPVLELLAAGSRLGDERRVRPVAEALIDQLRLLPDAGPGSAAAAWLELQLALAGKDDPGVRLASATLQNLSTSANDAGQELDRRASARVAAAAIWSALTERTAEEAETMAAADLMVAVGDGWEASRILGQAALDQSDPKVARRLLEAARSASIEVTDAAGDGGLVALGLSEREAEVAQLVCDGKTYKEIGAQLYISPKTVEHHVANIRQKLGAESRADMVAMVRAAI